MRIAICDDDARCLQVVEDIVSAYRAQRNPDVLVSAYESAAAMMADVMRRGSADVYLLDIIMPGMNGIDLGLQLRRDTPDAKIIYLTTSSEYAVDSYRVRAFDYLIKPVNQDRLFAALDEAALSIANRRDKSLIVRTKECSTKVSFDSIIYAELVNKSIVYHLTSGAAVEGLSIRTTFSEAIAEMLNGSRFALCGSSIAVNMYYITTIDNAALHFKNGSELYIGLRAARSLRSIWGDFWMNQEESR